MHSQSITGAGIGIAVLDTGIYPHIDFEEVDNLSNTERGTGGYGSTGK